MIHIILENNIGIKKQYLKLIEKTIKYKKENTALKEQIRIMAEYIHNKTCGNNCPIFETDQCIGGSKPCECYISQHFNDIAKKALSDTKKGTNDET